MTKVGELKLLEQIAGLIKSAGEDSYIHDTFAGIVDICRNNIVDDFGNHPVEDLEELRKRYHALELDCKGMAETLKAKDAEIEKLGTMLDGKVAECERLRDERDVMMESADGLGEIIDEMEKKIRMYETEIAQYARGDVFAEVRLDQTRRVVVIRGLYEKFCVGTQKHITENASCQWAYMTNGWKWEDAKYCNDEEEVKKVFKEIVIAERRKECGK